jgi:Ca-activated chloride channel family protein
MSCLGGARVMGFSRRKGKHLAALLCLMLFSSCAKTQGQLLIMQANFLNTRGYYTEAISSYLKALDYEEAAPYAEYGLASTFFSLDESSAALDRYNEAEKELALREEDHPELRYRILYNKGIIYFEKGQYGEAALAFREALKVDGRRIAAKRHLELSLLTEARRLQAYSREGTDDSKEGYGKPVLFEYIKAKEQEQWKSREWSGESDPGGLDY